MVPDNDGEAAGAARHPGGADGPSAWRGGGLAWRLAIVASLLLAAAHWVALPIVITYDGHRYLELANLFGGARFWQHWAPLRMPGFPFALRAALSLLGRNALAAQAVPLFFGVGGSLLTATAVRRTVGDWAGAVTLVLLACYPTLVGFEHAILTETGSFFFLALAMRLAVWIPRTPTQAWGRALALGGALGGAFLWRQTILAIAPLLMILQAVAARRTMPRRARLLSPLLQASVLLVVPLAVQQLWTAHLPASRMSGRLFQNFALKQMVIDPADPRIAPIAAEYRAAIADAAVDSHPEGLSWLVVERLAVSMPRGHGPRPGVLDSMSLVRDNPVRYLRGVARTLLLFAGFDRGVGESKRIRDLALNPDARAARIGDGRPDLTVANREEFAQRVPPGRLRASLWWLRVFYDRGLVVANFATGILLLVALRRGDQALIAISGVPLMFMMVHAALVMAMDRFMVPAYPLTIAAGVVLAFTLGRAARSRLASA